MPDLEPLQEVALRVERALGNMNPGDRLRGPNGDPLFAKSNPASTTMVEGYITAHDLYELAFAVLYHKLERVGKAGEGYEARSV